MANLVGKIVRRKLPSGIVIGPYLIVNSQIGDILLVTDTSNKAIFKIHKHRVKKVNYICLRVHKKLFYKLWHKKQDIIIHPLTPLYKRILEKDYEIVKFQDSWRNSVFYVLTNAFTYKSLLENKAYIRVYLGSFICTV